MKEGDDKGRKEGDDKGRKEGGRRKEVCQGRERINRGLEGFGEN
jgi:hypothetical protein